MQGQQLLLKWKNKQNIQNFFFSKYILIKIFQADPVNAFAHSSISIIFYTIIYIIYEYF